MTLPATGDDRAAQLRAGLDAVESRIARACADAGRDRADVQLVVVTKFFPADDVCLLAAQGVTHIGENRDQEARDKVGSLVAAVRDGLTVHFIGQLQTNKVASVASYADVVHSVDRPRLVGALDRAAGSAGRTLGALIQVDLDGDDGAGRGGVPPAGAAELADAVAACENLNLRGVMAVAPLGAEPAPVFARLREVAAGIRSQHPQASWISAGMSGDLEAALAHGATHLRVGSAILGSRPPVG